MLPTPGSEKALCILYMAEHCEWLHCILSSLQNGLQIERRVLEIQIPDDNGSQPPRCGPHAVFRKSNAMHRANIPIKRPLDLSALDRPEAGLTFRIGGRKGLSIRGKRDRLQRFGFTVERELLPPTG